MTPGPRDWSPFPGACGCSRSLSVPGGQPVPSTVQNTWIQAGGKTEGLLLRSDTEETRGQGGRGTGSGRGQEMDRWKVGQTSGGRGCRSRETTKPGG